MNIKINVTKQKKITIGIFLIIIVLYIFQIGYTRITKEEEISIIGYHHIVPDKDKEAYYKNSMWVNSLSSFEAQMKLLYEEGYQSVTLEDVYEWRMGRKELAEKSVVITFDDGFYSSIKFAQPVLQKYGFQGSVFVIGSLIEPERISYQPTKRQHASLEDMQDVKNMKFYSHSFNLHKKDGDFRVNQLTRQELKQDTEKEAQLISTDFYAYPYGKYNPLIQEVLKEHHTKLAFGYNENRKAKRSDDPYGLPRFNVNAYTKLDVFRQMIE